MSEAGRISVGIEVRLDQLEQGLRSVETRVAQSTRHVDEQTKRSSFFSGAFTERLARGFVGLKGIEAGFNLITAAVHAARGNTDALIATIRSIPLVGPLIGSVIDLVEAFSDSADQAERLAANTEKMNKQLERLRQLGEANRKSGFEQLGSTGDLERQREDLRQERQAAGQRLDVVRSFIPGAESKDRFRLLEEERRLEETVLRLLESEQNINVKINTLIDDRNKAIDKELNTFFDAVDRMADAEVEAQGEAIRVIAAIRKAQMDKDRKDAEDSIKERLEMEKRIDSELDRFFDFDVKVSRSMRTPEFGGGEIDATRTAINVGGFKADRQIKLQQDLNAIAIKIENNTRPHKLGDPVFA